MTPKWITTKLPLDTTGNSVILLGNPGYTVEVQSLANITANITDANATYANLCAATLVMPDGSNATPQTSGWQPIFDDWHTKNIV